MAKTGGRQKGTPNRRSKDIADTLKRLGCDPIEGMARIAIADIPCLVCEGSKKAKYSLDSDGKGYRVFVFDPENGKDTWCRRCLGKGVEPITPELRGKMNAELAQYIHPKRKAIEHSGPDGEAVTVHVIRRIIVDPRCQS